MVTPLLYCLLLGQVPQPTAPPAPAPVQAPADAAKPAPEAPKPSLPPVTKVEDNGLLEHAYFGAVIPFAARNGVDALWIKEGLSLKGKRVAYGSWDTKMLKAGRQEKDLQRGSDLAKLIPDALMPQLRVTFQGVADWELGGKGDYRFEARVVDANQPNKASKLAFGWLGGKDNLENVTWDMKLVDAVTGETVLAFHHRMVKVNTLGSLDGSLRDWAAAFPRQLLDLVK
jgi:hypothetical protein